MARTIVILWRRDMFRLETHSPNNNKTHDNTHDNFQRSNPEDFGSDSPFREKLGAENIMYHTQNMSPICFRLNSQITDGTRYEQGHYLVPVGVAVAAVALGALSAARGVVQVRRSLSMFLRQFLQRQTNKQTASNSTVKNMEPTDKTKDKTERWTPTKQQENHVHLFLQWTQNGPQHNPRPRKNRTRITNGGQRMNYHLTETVNTNPHIYHPPKNHNPRTGGVNETTPSSFSLIPTRKNSRRPTREFITLSSRIIPR